MVTVSHHPASYTCLRHTNKRAKNSLCTKRFRTSCLLDLYIPHDPILIAVDVLPCTSRPEY